VVNKDNLDKVHLIDFGLAKRYRDSRTQQHIPYREQRSLTGTARYSSVNTHLGIEQSRRDDLESIGYMLIFLLCGKLPWQHMKGVLDDRYKQIMDVKVATPVESLCGKSAPFLPCLLKYCRALGFEDAPDYAYLRSLLQDSFSGQRLVDDGVFDWAQSRPAAQARVETQVSLPVCSQGQPWPAAVLTPDICAALGKESMATDRVTVGSTESKLADNDELEQSAGHARFFASLFGCGSKSAVKA